MDKLLQDITKRLLTMKGSNTFHPTFGGTLYSLLGKANLGTEDEIREMLPVMIKNIQEDIIENQSLDPSLEDSERLLSLDIVDIQLDDQLLGWVIKLQVVTRDYTKNKFTVL